MTPYYEQDGIVIYHGDCQEVLPLVDFSVLITDPPYGINGGRGGDAKDFGKGDYLQVGWTDTENYIQTVCAPVVATILNTRVPRGAVTPGIRCSHMYPVPTDIGCLWTPAAATHGPWGFQCFHPIFYYGRDPRAGLGAWPSSRQVTESSEKNGHPCPKPEQAWSWLVAKVAKDGDTILDPFMGSGTTLVAAKRLGHKAIGIDIEEKYCEIAATRLAQGSLFSMPHESAYQQTWDDNAG